MSVIDFASFFSFLKTSGSRGFATPCRLGMGCGRHIEVRTLPSVLKRLAEEVASHEAPEKAGW